MHILLITRHYPPEISGGARRPYLFVQGLRDLGHQVTLITPFELKDPDSICVPNSSISRSLNQADAAEIPEHTSSLNQRLKAGIREWVFWPDADIRWAHKVVQRSIELNLQPDWIMTTSPPESIHLAGAKLSKKLEVPWLAEMRDTWIQAPHRSILEQSKFRAFIEKIIAKRALSKVSALTAVSKAVLSEGLTFTESQTPNCIIPHFSNTTDRAYAFDDNKINIVHSGGMTLSDRRRQLSPLLTELEPIFAKRPELVLHIVGPLTTEEIAVATQSSVSVKLHGRVSLSESRALQAGSDALLLYTPNNSHALPGKFAEYVMAKRPILYLGGGGWLNLVKDHNSLRPLVEGVTRLSKGEIVVHAQIFTEKNAAEQLVSFLQSTKT